MQHNHKNTFLKNTVALVNVIEPSVRDSLQHCIQVTLKKVSEGGT